MSPRTLRGKIVVAGIGETTYYKHSQSPDPEFVLALKAIIAACDDAGIKPKEIDGFASYSNDRNEPSRLAAALGIPDLKFSNMQWGGGGGGGSGAIGNAAAAINAGLAAKYNLIDNFIWANDYPHHEGPWPHSAEAIERTMSGLNERQRGKILGLNAAKFFNFDVPAAFGQPD